LIFVTGSSMALKGGADPKDFGYVYVTSQGLYYKTFVSQAPLKYNGHNDNSFQELYDGMTDFGPGDPGYRGGRWWIDDNPNGYPDEGDTFVLCPLIGPGLEEIPE
jgi:hypothetical protein